MPEVLDRLLDTIKADPSPDAPRRAFGDELRRAGDPRAELFAVQCDLAALAHDDPARRPLERREVALLRALLPVWSQVLGVEPGDLTAFDRGFPDEASAWPHLFLPLDARIARATPLSRLWLRSISTQWLTALAASRTATGLRELRITDIDRPSIDAATLAGSPAFAQLRSLSLGGLPLDDAAVHALVTSPHLAQLRSLRLDGAKLTRKGLLDILGEPAFARLRALSVSGTKLNAAWARSLASSARAGSLEQLQLASDRLGGDGMQAILDSTTLASLTQLSLRENQTESGPPVLVGPALASTLRRLDLTLNALDDRWAVAFAGARPLALTHLDLRSNVIGIDGVRALVASPHLASLESLSVAAPKATMPRFWGSELASVVALPGFRRLRGFNADGARVTASGVAALAASPHAAGLRTLRLSFNKLGPDGARALAASPHLVDLEALSLGNCDLGDEGITALCQGNFPRVRHLEISGNGIGERGHAALLRTSAFPSLRTLACHECQDPTRRAALENALGALVDIGDFPGSLGLRPPEDWIG